MSVKRILMDHSGYELMNVGDVAMLEALTSEFARALPDVEFLVTGYDADRLARAVPNGRWVAPAAKYGLLAPASIRRFPVALEQIYRMSFSRLPHQRFRIGTPLQQALESADAVVAAGGGYLTDAFSRHALGVLGLLDVAQRRGLPTAMFGQGIGPLTKGSVHRQMARVFPRLDVLGLREAVTGPEYARAFGAAVDRTYVTGDSALSLIDRTGAEQGDRLGINFRSSGYAHSNEVTFGLVATVLADFVSKMGTSLLSLPISAFSGSNDNESVAGAFAGTSASPELPEVETPADFIAEASACRAVVTGSYHAAVFSLGQGVPVVGLTFSPYYDAKFAGLRDLYPDICHIVDVREFDGDRVFAALLRAWESPSSNRDNARHTTRRLVDANREAVAAFIGCLS